MGKCPRVGTKKEAKFPAPGIVAFQHLCSFFLLISEQNVQLFSILMQRQKLQGQQYMLVDSD